MAQDFHANGALPGDHVRIVKRLHEHELTLRRELIGVRLGIRERFAAQHDFDILAAEGAHRVDLHLGRRHRHDDDGFAAQPRG